MGGFPRLWVAYFGPDWAKNGSTPRIHAITGEGKRPDYPDYPKGG